MIELKPQPHKEAQAILKGKPAVSRQVFDAMLPEIRARAFAITGIEDANILQRVRDRIADLPMGANWAEVREDVATNLSAFLVDSEDPEERAKQTAAAYRRSELLLRTHGFQAYEATSYNAMMETREAFPFWQYQTSADDRVRDEHAALNNLVLPADSPFWKDHYPPWDWGCRCTVVPLSPEDVDQIRKDDAKRLPEDHLVLGPAAQRRLEQDGELTRSKLRLIDPEDPTRTKILETKAGGKFDVRSPAARAEDPAARRAAFGWEPGSLRMPVEQLEARYDAATWATFVEEMKRAVVVSGSDSLTAWQWLTGEAAVKTATAAVKSASAPVSAAVAVVAKGATRIAAQAALAAIDQVHDDGDLPTVPVRSLKSGGGTLGLYRHRFGKPVEIRVNGSGPWPTLTAAHEVGHLIDQQVLHEAARFASETAPALAKWRAAVKASGSYAFIVDTKVVEWAYFASERELFARSYAQWIAMRSNDARLLKELNTAREYNWWRQWSDEEFKPIGEALDEVFKGKGWLL